MKIDKEEIQFDHSKFGHFNLSQTLTKSKRHKELGEENISINFERIQKDSDILNLSITVANKDKLDLYYFFTALKFRDFDAKVMLDSYNLSMVNLSIISNLSYSTTPTSFSVSFSAVINYVKS